MKIEEVISTLDYIKYCNDYKRCRESLAIEAAIKACEKQMPLTTNYSNYDDNGFGDIIPYKAECPSCGHEFEFGTWNDDDNHHCVYGQTIDWK